MSSQTEDEDPASDFQYTFETYLWKLAGAVQHTDSPDEGVAKVQRMWRLYHTDLICDTANLYGNVLKLAVRNLFPNFIETLALQYTLDLNFVDPVDGKTVLDFMRDERTRLTSLGLGESGQVKELALTYQRFKTLGLKHATDLNRR